jgi:hypothetical protein
MIQKEIWAFIDFENIPTLEGLELVKFSKIYIFIGAKQNKISLGSEKIELLSEFHFLTLKDTSPNNLDFHISYYLGKFDTLADNTIQFEIISNDTGFDPLIKHIKKNGRKCERKKMQPKVSSKTQVSINKPPIISPLTPDQLQLKLVQKLSSTNNAKRPKTEITLKNFVKSHLGLQNDSLSAQREFNKLVKSNLVSFEGKNIKYQLENS